MRSIIDGPIDGDKLDYLRRDALHSGVFFANSIDLDRFFESLRACVRTDGTAKTLVPAIGVSEKGVAPIETILTARYHMYSIVYWHRTARCLTAILQRVISDICLMLGETARIDVFLAQLVEKFRRLDDRQALYWLKGEVERVGLSAIPAGTQTDAHGGLTERVTLTGLIDALLGLRKNFFGTGFELGYVGPVNPDSSKEITPREQLHDDMCGIIYAADKDGGGSGSGRHDNRARLREFRLELEKAFSLEISQKTHGDFVLDTILIDVPEPGKDQVKGVFVDRHTKRSWIGQEVDIHVVFDDLSSIRQSPHPSGKSLHDGLGRLEFL